MNKLKTRKKRAGQTEYSIIRDDSVIVRTSKKGTSNCSTWQRHYQSSPIQLK